MAGTMSQDDLVADLKASLQDAAGVFTAANDADFVRQLDQAARDLGRFRPRTLIGTLALEADVNPYAAPGDLAAVKSHLWGISPRAAQKPWDKAHPGRLPDVSVIEVNGIHALTLSPPPTAFQIGVLGSEFRYYYFARHSVSPLESDTTVREEDRGLLLLRAQAEAMKELSMRNIKKPVQMRDGLASAPRNGTPAALYQALLSEFEKAAS